MVDGEFFYGRLVCDVPSRNFVFFGVLFHTFERFGWVVCEEDFLPTVCHASGSVFRELWFSQEGFLSLLVSVVWIISIVPFPYSRDAILVASVPIFRGKKSFLRKFGLMQYDG